MTDSKVRRPMPKRQPKPRRKSLPKKTPVVESVDIFPAAEVKSTKAQTKEVRMLTIADIPSNDVLLDLGIDVTSTGDFLKALQFVVCQVNGMNVKQACATSGLFPQLCYEPKWQTLISQARRLILGNSLMSVQATKVAVFDAWPALVEKLIDTALNAPRPSDSNEAIELLHLMYIREAGEAPDTSSAQKYLREQPNFAPQSPLNMIVESGANVTINHTPAPASVDYVDVEAIPLEDAPPAPTIPMAGSMIDWTADH